MPIFVFLYLPAHSLASQLAGCVVGLECSLSTCGLENPAVPFLPLLPPNATFPGAGCPSWHRDIQGFSLPGCSCAGPSASRRESSSHALQPCQALCGVIRTRITALFHAMCHISSPGAWTAEGTAGNHSGKQSGASKKSVSATFPPLCCALCSLRHLCLSCVLPKEEWDSVFRVVTALSPPGRSQEHRGPGERL